MFSSKIWFVKTSARIMKYESRVVKSNPAQVLAKVTLKDLPILQIGIGSIQ